MIYLIEISKNPIKKKDPQIPNCSINNLGNINKELYKRIIIPIYIPVLLMISMLLIINSKENINFVKYRNFIFTIGLLVIIFSETTLRLVGNNFLTNMKLILLPTIILITVYAIYIYKFNYKKIN